MIKASPFRALKNSQKNKVFSCVKFYALSDETLYFFEIRFSYYEI